MDDLIVMNDPSLAKFLYKLVPGGTLFINSSIVKSEITRTDVKVVKVPVTEMALEMGNAKVLNIIMLGAYVGYTQVVPEDVVWNTIEHKLGKKPKLLPLNKAGLRGRSEDRQRRAVKIYPKRLSVRILRSENLLSGSCSFVLPLILRTDIMGSKTSTYQAKNNS